MDLWDLTRLLLRRWYFAVPMLVVTVAVVYLAAQTVSPDYKATGYMQLIPSPSSGKPADPDAKPRPANPWLDLGYAALGNAAALTVTNPTALEKLVDEGFSDSITVVLNERTPLFEIEVVGDSKEQATGTIQRVIKLLQDDIAAKQKQYGALPEDTISTLVINDGSAPEQDTGTRKRVLIVAAGLGVLLTTASTIVLDYWLRRRRHRDDEGDGAGGDPPGPVRSEPVRARPSDEAEKTQVLRPQQRQGNHAGGVRHSTETRPRQSHAQRDTNGPVDPVDATVILPTSYQPWNAQKKRS
ncbi:hypothetical protein [Actinoplanes flavus]|uniref:Capsular polysaccharide biosynthesis protein n=1 Tax=Actinoplanes flavus TaxID=2820290 RepID=A0ABS3UXJ5_9ACTN|nr:hypothetical protein [Actinoplanes flavus]MBO3743311.1 hypothetical protein [Actinoplanes flavus]